MNRKIHGGDLFYNVPQITYKHTCIRRQNFKQALACTKQVPYMQITCFHRLFLRVCLCKKINKTRIWKGVSLKIVCNTYYKFLYMYVTFHTLQALLIHTILTVFIELCCKSRKSLNRKGVKSQSLSVLKYFLCTYVAV